MCHENCSCFSRLPVIHKRQNFRVSCKVEIERLKKKIPSTRSSHPEHCWTHHSVIFHLNRGNGEKPRDFRSSFYQKHFEILFNILQRLYSYLKIHFIRNYKYLNCMTSDLSLDRLYIFRFFTYLSTLDDKEKNVTKTCKRCRISIVLIQSLLHS